MKSDNILSPNVMPNEDMSGSSETLAEKHRLRKVVIFSSVRKYFHPNKRRYEGDHATIFRTIHITTGGTLNNRLAGAATKIMRAQKRI